MNIEKNNHGSGTFGRLHKRTEKKPFEIYTPMQ